MNQAKEIVFRNKGDIKDFINHIEQELHLNAVHHYKLNDVFLKDIICERILFLQTFKIELQMALIEYREEEGRNQHNLITSLSK